MFLIDDLICATLKELEIKLLRIDVFMMDVIKDANSTIHSRSLMSKSAKDRVHRIYNRSV